MHALKTPLPYETFEPCGGSRLSGPFYKCADAGCETLKGGTDSKLSMREAQEDVDQSACRSTFRAADPDPG